MSGYDDRGEEARGTAIAVDKLAEDARSLTQDVFEDQHGSAFLMIGDIDLDAPRGPGATVARMDYVDDPDARPVEFNPNVHPIRRTGRSVGHLVSVGRTSNNDVVVPDVSVSRFHAFLKERHGDSPWSIQDAGSTNGTEVNAQPIPSQGNGAPVTLKSGDRIRIGQVDFTFIDSELLIRLLSGAD
jgi:pSer/pThr/pTyr-binding forkhead associated (FHA) protein